MRLYTTKTRSRLDLEAEWSRGAWRLTLTLTSAASVVEIGGPSAPATCAASRDVPRRMGSGGAMDKDAMDMEVEDENVGKGMTSYYTTKIGGLERDVREKTLNLQRLTAQRNELNARVRMLRGPAASSWGAPPTRDAPPGLPRPPPRRQLFF